MTHSNTATKKCTSCNEEKPATTEYFYHQKLGKYGLESRCKICKAEYGRARDKAIRDRHSEFLRQWGDNAPPTKECGTCGEEKPATTEYFSRKNSSKYGLAAHCKICLAAAGRAWYENNRERKAKTDRAWRERNPGRRAETNRARYERNRGRHEEFLREWGESDPPTQKCITCKKEKSATTENFKRHNTGKYGLESRCKVCRAECTRTWAENNQEYLAKARRAWRENNPDRYRALQRIAQRRRRARKLAAEGTHTARDVQQQYKNQRGRCYYCQIKVGDDYHLDHVIPLSRGGANDLSNLVIACPTCNLSKGAKLPHEFPEGGRLL